MSARFKIQESETTWAGDIVVMALRIRKVINGISPRKVENSSKADLKVSESKVEVHQ